MRAKTRALQTVLLGGLAIGACSGSLTDANEQFLGCAQVGSIQVGGSVLGSLSTSDCRESAGAYIDLYELRLSSSRSVAINLSSVRFDAYLVLLNRPTGQVVAQNNDIDIFTTDSRIQATLAGGTYVIVVTSYRVGEEGPYRLEVDPVP